MSGALGLTLGASIVLAPAYARGQAADESSERDAAAADASPPPGAQDRAPPTIAPIPETQASELDEITLRDGRKIRGRIVVREPGRWVVIETENGRRKTLPWDRVEEIDVAARTADAAVSDAAARTWRLRSGSGMSFELRGIAAGAILPREEFRLTGSCSTGSGRAPASIYGQTASDRARGVGLGVGGRASYMFMSTIDPKVSSSWWGLRVGLGLDLQILYVDKPVGIATKDGELCTAVSRTPHPVEHEGSPLVMATIPLHLGTHFAFGSFEEWSWRGVVLGAAWAPSSIHVGLLSDYGGTYFNYLGFELTLDFVTLHARTPKRSPKAHTRLSAFVSIPQDPSRPLVGTLGIGTAWY